MGLFRQFFFNCHHGGVIAHDLLGVFDGLPLQEPSCLAVAQGKVALADIIAIQKRVHAMLETFLLAFAFLRERCDQE